MTANTNTPTTLGISYWNASGVTNKKEELITYLHDENIDVMMLGETWLRENVVFKIANYKTYRTDRRHQQGGGTAILIK